MLRRLKEFLKRLKKSTPKPMLKLKEEKSAKTKTHLWIQPHNHDPHRRSEDGTRSRDELLQSCPKNPLLHAHPHAEQRKATWLSWSEFSCSTIILCMPLSPPLSHLPTHFPSALAVSARFNSLWRESSPGGSSDWNGTTWRCQCCIWKHWWSVHQTPF